MSLLPSNSLAGVCAIVKNIVQTSSPSVRTPTSDPGSHPLPLVSNRPHCFSVLLLYVISHIMNQVVLYVKGYNDSHDTDDRLRMV